MLYADNLQFAQRLLGEDLRWGICDVGSVPPSFQPVLNTLVGTDTICRADASLAGWTHTVIVDSARESQFDALNRVARSGAHSLGDVLCVAASGRDFHGFKGRPWATLRGNLHLSALLLPNSTIDHPGAAFTVLAVVSVLQTLDELGALPQPAAVKWVNDILVGGAKIGGVLSSTQMQEDVVIAATLGIGLNIGQTPVVPPTPFVPEVGSLRQLSRDPARCSLSLVFLKLITYLEANYRSLCAGGFRHLLEVYRSRSLAPGRSVRIHQDRHDTPDQQPLSGVVSSIGDDLELFLDGVPSPVLTGRLELLST